jgi:hypothetical protein
VIGGFPTVLIITSTEDLKEVEIFNILTSITIAEETVLR